MAYAKARETEGNIDLALDAYDRAGDHESRIRLLLSKEFCNNFYLDSFICLVSHFIPFKKSFPDGISGLQTLQLPDMYISMKLYSYAKIYKPRCSNIVFGMPSLNTVHRSAG